MNDFPEAFKRTVMTLLGDEAASFFLAMNQPCAAALRLNPLRDGPQAAAAAYIDDSVPWCPDGRYIREGTRPGLSPLHAAGCFYIQEASAMAPAQALGAVPGELILDLCAAPGGKSGQIAAALGQSGALVSNEPDAGRARILSSTMERLGVANSLVTNAWPHELAARFPETFDAILVDAPCSGEGMFRRNPASRDEWRDNSPAGCAARQSGILDQAAVMLRPGGRLIYSTCTFNALENEGSVRAFLERHAEFSPSEFELPGVGRSEHGMLRLWPHRLRGDGHFVARLRKAGSGATAAFRPAGSDRQASAVLPALLDVAPGLKARLAGFRLVRRGDYVLALPECLPDASGLRVLRSGLTLCRVGRGYIEPNHALAMALSPNEAARSVDLSEEDALRYLAGQVLPCEEAGWTLVTHRRMPLGWGKASQGQLKNHLPKGLRIHI